MYFHDLFQHSETPTTGKLRQLRRLTFEAKFVVFKLTQRPQCGVIWIFCVFLRNFCWFFKSCVQSSIQIGIESKPRAIEAVKWNGNCIWSQCFGTSCAFGSMTAFHKHRWQFAMHNPIRCKTLSTIDGQFSSWKQFCNSQLHLTAYKLRLSAKKWMAKPISINRIALWNWNENNSRIMFNFHQIYDYNWNSLWQTLHWS